MTIEKNYRDNESLRNSFNELAGKVFGGLILKTGTETAFGKIITFRIRSLSMEKLFRMFR